MTFSDNFGLITPSFQSFHTLKWQLAPRSMKFSLAYPTSKKYFPILFMIVQNKSIRMSSIHHSHSLPYLFLPCHDQIAAVALADAFLGVNPGDRSN